MKKKILSLILFLCLPLAAACSGKNTPTAVNSEKRDLIFNSDKTNAERNLLLTEDILYFQKELPKRHKNLYDKISRESFISLTESLISKVDQLDTVQVFIEIGKILAEVKDAHTDINLLNGYAYPLRFWLFDDELYVIDANEDYKEMINARVLKIDGNDIGTVINKLSTVIPHENESWLLAMLQSHLRFPVYLYGLGMQEDENQAVFTVEKDGEMLDFAVNGLDYFSEEIKYVNQNIPAAFTGKAEKNYDYKYYPDKGALYFEYNQCANMEGLPFKDFNREMFELIEKNKPDKIIIDLRSNTGGNSEVLNPFTDELKKYVRKNKDLKVYMLIGRYTFSSGMFAIFRIREAAPGVVAIGEATGGAIDCYGDVRSFMLPNSGIPINYSTKYFSLSKVYGYKSDSYECFKPDVELLPSFDDYKAGIDPVLEYAFTN